MFWIDARKELAANPKRLGTLDAGVALVLKPEDSGP